MSDIPTEKLAALSGLSSRQVRRLAVLGEVPGAVRTPGGHWSIPDGPAVRAWARDHHEKKRERRERDGLDYRRELRLKHSFQKGVLAAETLLAHASDDLDTLRPTIANGAERLHRALTGSATNRGGAWSEVELAAQQVALWHALHWHNATPNEKSHFRRLVGKLTALDLS